MIDYKELAHFVMGAEKSHDLPLQTGGPGELVKFKPKSEDL